MGHVELDFGKYIDLIQAWSKGILSHYTETNTHLAEKEINQNLPNSKLPSQIFLLCKNASREYMNL